VEIYCTLKLKISVPIEVSPDSEGVNFISNAFLIAISLIPALDVVDPLG
jgi:hypothetical protein